MRNVIVYNAFFSIPKHQIFTLCYTFAAIILLKIANCMAILDYITIFLFTAGILVAGMSFAKTGSSMKSFFAAGGDVPWWISGLSLFMGFFSAGTFVVWGSIFFA